jgi:hypothetical protein
MRPKSPQISSFPTACLLDFARRTAFQKHKHVKVKIGDQFPFRLQVELSGCLPSWWWASTHSAVSPRPRNSQFLSPSITTYALK